MPRLADIPTHTLARFLLAVFAFEWALLAIAPNYRQDWALENVLTVLFLWWLVRRYRRQSFSSVAYLMIFLFGSLHTVGSHYTYAEVPYDDWFKVLSGQTLGESAGLGRNHFDRLMHFLFGLLLFKPTQELLFSPSMERGFWTWLMPVGVLWGLSSLYEIIEWWAAEVFGGDLGTAYLGTQGDVWDAQKDMLAAHVGAVIAALAYVTRTRVSLGHLVVNKPPIPKYEIRLSHD